MDIEGNICLIHMVHVFENQITNVKVCHNTDIKRIATSLQLFSFFIKHVVFLWLNFAQQKFM